MERRLCDRCDQQHFFLPDHYLQHLHLHYILYNITAIVCGITIPLVSIIIALVVVIIMLYRQKKAEPMTTSTARAMAEVQSSTSINPVAANVVDDESQQYTQSPLGK